MMLPTCGCPRAWGRLDPRALVGALLIAASASVAQTIDIDEYFIVDQDSFWHYIGFEGGSAEDDFTWTVEDTFEAVHSTQASRLRTDTDEASDDRNGDVDFWSFDGSGQLLMHGFYKGAATSGLAGNQTIHFDHPVVFGQEGMPVGWTNTDSVSATVIIIVFGFPTSVTATITAKVTYAEFLPVKNTPMGEFENVAAMTFELSVEGTPFRENTLFLAPGVGMVAQNQKADPNDAELQGIEFGEVGGVPITLGSTAGISVVPTTGLVTTEAGGSDVFEVVLNSKPTANVAVGLSSSNPSEGTVAPAGLTFTPANWDTSQTVTVTGQDDDIDDDAAVYSIITAPAQSTDADYGGLDPSDVGVTNNDDDTAGVTVLPTAGLLTNEGGGPTPLPSSSTASQLPTSPWPCPARTRARAPLPLPG